MPRFSRQIARRGAAGRPRWARGCRGSELTVRIAPARDPSARPVASLGAHRSSSDRCRHGPGRPSATGGGGKAGAAQDGPWAPEVSLLDGFQPRRAGPNCFRWLPVGGRPVLGAGRSAGRPRRASPARRVMANWRLGLLDQLQHLGQGGISACSDSRRQPGLIGAPWQSHLARSRHPGMWVRAWPVRLEAFLAGSRPRQARPAPVRRALGEVV